MVLFKSGYAVIRFPVAVVQRLYVWEYRFFFVFQVLGHFVPVLVEKTGHNVRFVAGIAFNHIGQMPAYMWNTVFEIVPVALQQVIGEGGYGKRSHRFSGRDICRI